MKPVTSVLSPQRRSSCQYRVLTAPMSRALSVSLSTRGMTASLCGMVTLAPWMGRVRRAAMKAGSFSGGVSQTW